MDIQLFLTQTVIGRHYHAHTVQALQKISFELEISLWRDYGYKTLSTPKLTLQVDVTKQLQGLHSRLSKHTCHFFKPGLHWDKSEKKDESHDVSMV